MACGGMPSRGTAVADGAVQDVMPAAANPYFRAQRVFGRGAVRSWSPRSPSSSCSPARASSQGDGWDLAVKRGSTLVVPWGAGPVLTTGEVELLRCLPPLPEDARTDDPTA